MRRTKEKTEKEMADEERKTAYAKEITSAMKVHGYNSKRNFCDLCYIIVFRSKFLTEPSYAACEDLAFGRMSFKGANPEIEKLMKRFDVKTQTLVVDQVLENEKDADVGAEEVAKSMALTKTIAKKFSKQPHRNRGFKRPAED